LAFVSAAAAAAQQHEPSRHHPSAQGGDPESIGAGPTSRASGPTDYNPKAAPITTDDKGVTTTNPSGEVAGSDSMRRDQGNESYDAAQPERR
jgi:hypothetical protein